MGKHNVVPKLPNPPASKGGNERPLNRYFRPCLTQNEYRSAVIELVGEVKDASNDKENLLDLSSALQRLLLARYDPPLPLWWTFIAVEKSLWLDRQSEDPLRFGTAILDFARGVKRSLISFTSINASGRTSLAAIAPVVGLVYDVASLLSTTAGPLEENQSSSGIVDGNVKKVRKLARNLKAFIKELLGFRVLSHCHDSEHNKTSLPLPSAPVVSLESFPDYIYPPLPLASKGMAKSLSRDLLNSAVLADIVSGEVVLLQLVVESIDRRILLKKRNTNFNVGQDEFVQSLRSLAVHTVRGATNSPSEMIMGALLEKRLPVLDLLDAKEEILLRGVLFEAVLVDRPTFSLCAEAGEASTSSKSGLDHSSVVFMKKLSVARRAVAFYKSREERSRVVTLEMQMTLWHVPPQLLKWLKSQKKQLLPVRALQDQQALTNWLVNIAEKSVFSAILAKSVASWSSGLTSVGTAKHVEVLDVESGESPPDKVGEDLFFVDTAGEKAAIDTESAADLDSTANLAFEAAAKSMRGESEKMKKKKKSSKVLFQRHDQSSTGTKRSDRVGEDLFFVDTAGETKAAINTESAADLDSAANLAFEAAAKSMRGESEKMKKKKPSKVLFQTHDPSSAGTKRSTMEIDNADPSTSSSSDSEDSEGTGSKSARKVKKSKWKVIDVDATSEEDGDDDDDSALALSHLASVEESPQEKHGNVGTQKQAEVHLPHRTKTPKDHGVNKNQSFGQVMNGGAAEEEVPKVQQQVVAGTLLDNEEVEALGTPPVSSRGTLTLGPSPRSRKGKTVQQFEVTGGAGTEELSSQPAVMVNNSVSVIEVDIQNTSTISGAQPVLASLGKSGKKTKNLKDAEDPDIEASGAEIEDFPLHSGDAANIPESMAKLDVQNSTAASKLEPVLLSVGKSPLMKKKRPGNPDIEAGRAGTEELSSQLLLETVNSSVLATDVGTPLTTSPGQPVLLSVGKSPKKKKKTKSKDPEDPYIEAGGTGTEVLTVPSQLDKEMDNCSVSLAEVDIQNASSSAQLEPVLLSVGESAKKKMSKDPEGPDTVAGGARTEKLPSQLFKETVNTSGSVTEADMQNPATTSRLKPFFLPVGKSAKKKSPKYSEDPDREAPADDLGRRKDGPLLAGTPKKQLFNEDAEADNECKGAAYDNIVVSTTIEVVEASTEVQGVNAKDVAKEVELALQKEGGEDLGEIGNVAARVQSTTLSNVQEETLVVKSGKKKKRKEISRLGNEDDQIRILDAIKQELVTASVKLSSADVIDALQVEKTPQSDQQESSRNMAARNKRVRLGDEGNSIGDLQGTTTGEPAATVFVANSDAMKIENEPAYDGKSSQGDRVLAEEEAILSAILAEEILGNGQAEDVHGVRHGAVESNTRKPDFTQVNKPIDSLAKDVPQDSGRPVVESPIKDVEQPELRTQGTPASRTSSGSELVKNRDVTSTPTSRKKQSKDRIVTAIPAVAEERLQPKEEVVEIFSVSTSTDEKNQGEREVRTPELVQEDAATVISVKPSPRKRRAKPCICPSVESETTDEIVYQRRTRSGRALGTPPSTPSRKVYTRKKPALRPLDEK